MGKKIELDLVPHPLVYSPDKEYEHLSSISPIMKLLKLKFSIEAIVDRVIEFVKRRSWQHGFTHTQKQRIGEELLVSITLKEHLKKVQNKHMDVSWTREYLYIELFLEVKERFIT